MYFTLHLYREWVTVLQISFLSLNEAEDKADDFDFVYSVFYVQSEFQALFHHVVSELLGSKVDHDVDVEWHERLHSHAASERYFGGASYAHREAIEYDHGLDRFIW